MASMRSEKSDDDGKIDGSFYSNNCVVPKRNVRAPRDKTSTTNPHFVVGMRVCNRFPGYSELFWGVIAYTSLGRDGKTAVYGVCYDDGDREEYSDAEMLVCMICDFSFIINPNVFFVLLRLQISIRF